MALLAWSHGDVDMPNIPGKTTVFQGRMGGSTNT